MKVKYLNLNIKKYQSESKNTQSSKSPSDSGGAWAPGTGATDAGAVTTYSHEKEKITYNICFVDLYRIFVLIYATSYNFKNNTLNN